LNFFVEGAEVDDDEEALEAEAEGSMSILGEVSGLGRRCDVTGE
jgi:hypothetical protein